MNVIALVTKYLPILDLQYKLESKSAVLDVPPAFVQETKDAKKVKIAIIHTDGLANYSRSAGFVAGSMDLDWVEYTCEQDRGRSFQIDEMDNEESFGLAFGRLAGEFQRTKVIPEMDAFRFSRYYSHAGHTEEVALSSASLVAKIDAMDSIMDDDEVPESDRLIFCNPAVFYAFQNDSTLSKYFSVQDSEDKTVNKKIYFYNDHRLIKVPSNRFYTAITLNDGVTSGQVVGGYVPASGAKVISLMMIQRNSVVQIAKRRIARIWAPTKEQAAGTDGVNPDADAWKFDYRVYHDAWVFEQKVKGIYALVLTDIAVTAIALSSTDITITAGAAAVTLAANPTFTIAAAVTAAAGVGKDVVWSSSNTAKATVDQNGLVTLVATGACNIVCTSVTTPSKSAQVALTITAS